MKNILNRALGICFAFIIVLVSISLSVPDACLTVSAHSGRTDASGGHHDYKNKSGLAPITITMATPLIFMRMVSVHMTVLSPLSPMTLPRKPLCQIPLQS